MTRVKCVGGVHRVECAGGVHRRGTVLQLGASNNKMLKTTV